MGCTRTVAVCRPLAAIALMCSASCKSPNAVQSSGIEWVTNYQTGMEYARQQGKPVLTDLYADWCGPCRQLDTGTWSDPGVQALSGSFVSIKLDVDSDRATARTYQARAIPMTVSLHSNGTPIGHKIGFTRAPDMKRLVQTAVRTGCPVAAPAMVAGWAADMSPVAGAEQNEEWRFV